MMTKKISGSYSIGFEFSDEGIEIVIVPGPGLSLEEAEIAFAHDLKALEEAELVEIAHKGDGEVVLNVERLLE